VSRLDVRQYPAPEPLVAHIEIHFVSPLIANDQPKVSHPCGCATGTEAGADDDDLRDIPLDDLRIPSGGAAESSMRVSFVAHYRSGRGVMLLAEPGTWLRSA
jgi:hypothetical protein